MAGYISEDILYLILTRLPVKAILRWRCVCKSWKQVIDSTRFRADHLTAGQLQESRFTNSKLLILESGILDLYVNTGTGGDTAKKSKYYRVDKKGKHLAAKQRKCRIAKKRMCASIVSSSSDHGVICLYDQGHRLALWNPSLRRYLRIRPPRFPDTFFEHQAGTNDEHNEYMRCGFWIDSSNHDVFKIVLLCLKDDIAAVYLSTTQSWTSIPIDVPSEFEYDADHDADLVVLMEWEASYLGPQVLIEGVAYWIAIFFRVVVFFDFGELKFRTIELPNQLMSHKYALILCKWQGFLSILRWKLSSHSYCCQLWTRQNGSWSQMSSSLTVERPHIALTDRDNPPLYDHWRDGDMSVPANVTFKRHGVSFATDFVETLVFPGSKKLLNGHS